MHPPIGDTYRPEQAARSDTRIEVMDLIAKIIRDNLPPVEIELDEAERIGVLLPIHPNVGTLHEAHIAIKVEGLMTPRANVVSCSSTLNMSCSNCAMQIVDCRIFDIWSGADYIKSVIIRVDTF